MKSEKQRRAPRHLSIKRAADDIKRNGSIDNSALVALINDKTERASLFILHYNARAY